MLRIARPLPIMLATLVMCLVTSCAGKRIKPAGTNSVTQENKTVSGTGAGDSRIAAYKQWQREMLSEPPRADPVYWLKSDELQLALNDSIYPPIGDVKQDLSWGTSIGMSGDSHKPRPGFLGQTVGNANPHYIQSLLYADGSYFDSGQLLANFIKAGVEDDDAIVDRIKNLRAGTLACATPVKMKETETAKVVARIGDSGVSRDELTDAPPDLQKFVTVPTKISPVMKMGLTSTDFEINKLSSEVQAIGGSPTEWQWEVKPKHAGTLHLHLVAVVMLKAASRDFTTVDRNIAVEVDPIGEGKEFFSREWKWILSTLAAGVALWWKFFGPNDKGAKKTIPVIDDIA